MKFVYQSNNGWAINEQENLFGSDVFYTVYRFYPNGVGWVPFSLVGNSLPSCFVWLYKYNFISKDEMRHQIELLKKEDK